MKNYPRTARLGARGEQLAQAAYQKRGFKIIGKNLSNDFGKRLGEIDFIGLKDNLLVFVEVKTRTRFLTKFGSIYESVSAIKIKRILKTVGWFISTNKLTTHIQLRIDCCFVFPDQLDKTKFCVKIITNAVTDEFR